MFSAPEICQDDYRMPSQDELLYMWNVWFRNMGRPRLFIRTSEKGERLILELYFWDLMKYDGVKRIVVEPGRQLDEQTEDLFLAICGRNDLTFSSRNINRVRDLCSGRYPQIHLPEYKKQPGRLLLHVYFATWRSGPMEILYKANLAYMTETLYEMDEYDMIASSPKDLMGGIPVRLLRMLNNAWGKNYLLTEEKRREVLAVYTRFSSHLEEGVPLTARKFRYLKFCMEENMEWDRRSFCFVEKFEDMDSFYKYLDYLVLREKLKKYMDFPVSCRSVPDMMQAIYRAAELNHVLKRRNRYNYHFWQQYGENSSLCYEDEENIILLPQTVDDMIQEAKEQKNCLIEYIRRVANAETVVCFWRKRRAPKRSYITLEISKGEILQAYGRCNRRLTEDEKEWLAKVYCPEKELAYDPSEEVDLADIFGDEWQEERLPGIGWLDFEPADEEALPFS